MMFSLTGFSQLFQIGVKGGLNYADMKFNENTTTHKVDGTAKGGFHVGVVGRFNLVVAYVQPEILFTNLNTSITVTDGGGAVTHDDFSLRRIDVPVNVGLKLGPIGVFAGPIYSINLSDNSDVFQDYNKGSFGYQAGVGLKLLGILAEVKYEGSFQDFGSSMEVGSTAIPIDSRYNQWIISVGYLF